MDPPTDEPAREPTDEGGAAPSPEAAKAAQLASQSGPPDAQRGRNAPAPSGERELEKQLGGLLQQLQAEAQADQQAREGQDEAPPVEASAFTFESMMVGLVVSAVGLGYLRWGRATASPILAATGVVLLVLPWVLYDALWLGLAGLGVAVLSAVVSRLLFPSSSSM